MGSIANKRGSVRQAPPDIYCGFMDGGDEDSWQETMTVWSHIGRLAILGLWIAILWIGWTVIVVWD